MNSLLRLPGVLLLVLLYSMFTWSPLLSLAAHAASGAAATSEQTPVTPKTNKPAYGGSVPVGKLDATASTVAATVKRTGNTYDTLRQALLISGWKPIVTSECRTNIMGDDAGDTCSKNPKDAQCHVCDAFPELESCSGDGYCLMQFSHPNSALMLTTTTYGNLARDSDSMVTGWDFKKTTPSQ